MSLARPAPVVFSNRSDPIPFASSMAPSTSFTLTVAGLLTPKIKITPEAPAKPYTFQSKSSSSNRSMTLKDSKSNTVCRVKNTGEHLLDLNLTTDSKDINVQFRDMIAFKKAVERNAHQMAMQVPRTARTNPNNSTTNTTTPLVQYSSHHDDDDDGRSDYLPSPMGTSGQNVCWAFEFEARIYQWSASSGHGVHAPLGHDVLVCHSTGTGRPTKIAALQSCHTGASDRLTIYNGPTASVVDKTGLQILILASVLSLMEVLNDRSRELLDFD